MGSRAGPRRVLERKSGNAVGDNMTCFDDHDRDGRTRRGKTTDDPLNIPAAIAWDWDSDKAVATGGQEEEKGIEKKGILGWIHRDWDLTRAYKDSQV